MDTSKERAFQVAKLIEDLSKVGKNTLPIFIKQTITDASNLIETLELIKNAADGYQPEKKKKKVKIGKSENEKVVSLIEELKEIAFHYNQAVVCKLNFSIPRSINKNLNDDVFKKLNDAFDNSDNINIRRALLIGYFRGQMYWQYKEKNGDEALDRLGISRSGFYSYISFYEFTQKYPLVLLITSTSRTFIIKKIKKITEEIEKDEMLSDDLQQRVEFSIEAANQIFGIGEDKNMIVD